MERVGDCFAYMLTLCAYDDSMSRTGPLCVFGQLWVAGGATASAATYEADRSRLFREIAHELKMELRKQWGSDPDKHAEDLFWTCEPHPQCTESEVS